MRACVEKVLVIGGGFSGMSAAIELSKKGIAVDLVEIDKDWRTDGAGISIGGATIRAFAQIGILDEFLAQGATHKGLDVHAPTGQHLAFIPAPPLMGKDAPGGGAIMRPVLAKILAAKTRETNVNVRLGITFEQINDRGDSIEVSFTDGTSDSYDLVIGADGLNSSVRRAVFPEAEGPAYIGQGVWRAVLPRLPEIDNVTMWVGPHIKAGVNPMSADEMYMFVTENRETNGRIDSATYMEKLKALLAGFPAPMVQKLAVMLDEDSLIHYRPLEGMLMPGPWYKNRVLLIGDTVHATTPHLASGACIGIEDAIVIADELARTDTLDEALAGFQTRRFERCRMVVENSGRLAQIEITGGDKVEHTNIMRDSAIALAQPI
ncbi:FAD-dependent oxidoreductase [uncultured Alteromonas sp.]|jgi:2-polyprenyl-6-methoxyphenol hydroxylase-like FAD-dependent oxidoreductase|uniref:FAD-dependent oxidoreductase n=1 Tax=uncultured Alteromonas sp. TaxID=179113 RepID=UPI0025E38B27|nr:FAD-dependent oxidoreductase [uncultured Alteromonas sp.]